MIISDEIGHQFAIRRDAQYVRVRAGQLHRVAAINRHLLIPAPAD